MDVILLERVEKLGQMGDIVTVKPGYARNFLLPRNKALRATDANKKLFEAQRAQIEAQNLERKKEAEGVAEKMEGTGVVLIRQAGESGQLYGSVTARDIAGALADAGFTTNKNQVILDRAIKTLGIHDMSVRLHPEVKVSVRVNIARSEDEAQTQFETGSAVVGRDDDDDDDIDELVDDLTDLPEDVVALAEGSGGDAAEEAAIE